MKKILDKSFYQRGKVTDIAKNLLGKVLMTNIDGMISGGIITETEAYSESERGCHAYNGKRTGRTEPMFCSGGISYVYLIYGMYQMFNVVTGPSGKAEAVLVRAVEPYVGLKHIEARRNMSCEKKEVTSGPGRLTKALGIIDEHNRTNLTGNQVWLEDVGFKIKTKEIEKATRIGIDYAGEDARLLWRFYIKNGKYISVR